jgi:O-acetyl-ADP-ribose deacetylase (regulator of RNase III)
LQVRNKVTKAAMPRIGCGIDGLEWGRVREILDKTFDGEFEIVVYNFVPK